MDEVETVEVRNADGNVARVNLADVAAWKARGYEAAPDVADPTPEQIEDAPIKRGPGRPRKA